MAAASGMLTDKDIRDQLALGANADLHIDRVSLDCISPVGYDVRAGETAFSLKKKKILALNARDAELAPGDTFFISTYESFALSNKLGGLTISRLSPLLDGLQMTALTVDPAWNGKLLIILANHGQKPFKVQFQQRLMTLCLFWASSPSVKVPDRTVWDDEKIHGQFIEIQRAAESRFKKQLLQDIAVTLLLLGVFLALRSIGLLEKYSESFSSWLAASAIYYSALRGKF